ncbi:hypothetical protein V8J88_12175 [Massilia sp. W12]|uniref:hypothetical protein n=1 Tax=Massilia sp. W12 TaxID=3126507 RepID=UPI0030CF58B5
MKDQWGQTGLISQLAQPDSLNFFIETLKYGRGRIAQHWRNDLRLAAQLEQPSPTPLGSAAMALYQMHCQTGAGKLDFSSVLQRFAQAAGNTDVN